MLKGARREDKAFKYSSWNTFEMDLNKNKREQNAVIAMFALKL
jgi:hypothetical protein